MKFLAWDTSARRGVVGAFVVEGERLALLSGMALDTEARHSERLLWAIDRVLGEAGFALGELGFLAVGVGPGSFTGLRIGLATAKTLGSALGIGVVPFSSLALMARPAARREASAFVVAASDACKGQVFALHGSASDVLACVGPRSAWPGGVENGVYDPEPLGAVLRARSASGPWIAVGDARERYPRVFSGLDPGDEIRDAPLPGPSDAGELGWLGYLRGFAAGPLAVLPDYLRESSAEIQRQARVAGA